MPRCLLCCTCALQLANCLYFVTPTYTFLFCHLPIFFTWNYGNMNYVHFIIPPVIHFFLQYSKQYTPVFFHNQPAPGNTSCYIYKCVLRPCTQLTVLIMIQISSYMCILPRKKRLQSPSCFTPPPPPVSEPRPRCSFLYHIPMRRAATAQWIESNQQNTPCKYMLVANASQLPTSILTPTFLSLNVPCTRKPPRHWSVLNYSCVTLPFCVPDGGAQKSKKSSTSAYFLLHKLYTQNNMRYLPSSYWFPFFKEVFLSMNITRRMVHLLDSVKSVLLHCLFPFFSDIYVYDRVHMYPPDGTRWNARLPPCCSLNICDPFLKTNCPQIQTITV